MLQVGRGTMPSVFISYSRRDTAFVRRVHDALRTRGYDVWVDWEDIPPSSTWFEEIRGGITAADDFVYVILPDSARSEAFRAFAVQGDLGPDATTLVTDTGGGLAAYACELCGRLRALEAVAHRHLTRGFSTVERSEFLVGG